MNDGAGTEREFKFSLDPSVALPAFTGLAPGLRIADRGVLELDARYFDTPDLQLAAAHIAVRHRQGHSWTYKGPSSIDGAAVVREECEWPESDVMPARLRQRLTDQIGAVELVAVARLRSLRHRVDVLNTVGERLLEVDDDDVTVIDHSGAEVERFREVEIEIVGAATEELVAALVAQLLASGAVQHVASKYARALRVLGYHASNSD